MANSDTAHYTAIMLEEVRDNVKVLLKTFSLMQHHMKSLARMEDLDEVRMDVKIIKKVVTHTSVQLTDHERRITKLELAQSS